MLIPFQKPINTSRNVRNSFQGEYIYLKSVWIGYIPMFSWTEWFQILLVMKCQKQKQDGRGGEHTDRF